jgi:hypothetical protein
LNVALAGSGFEGATGFAAGIGPLERGAGRADATVPLAGRGRDGRPLFGALLTIRTRPPGPEG